MAEIGNSKGTKKFVIPNNYKSKETQSTKEFKKELYKRRFLETGSNDSLTSFKSYGGKTHKLDLKIDGMYEEYSLMEISSGLLIQHGNGGGRINLELPEDEYRISCGWTLKQFWGLKKKTIVTSMTINLVNDEKKEIEFESFEKRRI